MKRINLSGQKFGKMNVISYSHSDSNRVSYYLCHCDCGKEKTVRGESLKSGDIKSCGCLRKERESGKNHNAWSGFGDISLSYFNSLKRGAESRGFIFDLTIEQIWKIFLQQDKKCAFSGVELLFQSGTKQRDGTASLDRIDSSKGYLIDNVQWVHKRVNFMKQSMEDSEFIEWCRKIAAVSEKEE